MRLSPVALGTIAGLILVGATPVSAEIGLDDFTAHITLTSDYVYRGVSQSDEDPAVQGGFEFEHPSGFFAGVWASSVDFPNNRQRSRPRDLEIDYYAGYGFGLGAAWSASAQLTRYTYPGDDPAFDYDYSELSLSVQWSDRLAASAHLSDDLLGRSERATAWELSGRLPLTPRLDAAAGIGHFDLDRVVGDSYDYWSVGLSWLVGRFALDLTHIDTSRAATDLFGSRIAGSRVVASVTAHLD